MAPIYHFTDIANLRGMLASGGLTAHRDAPCEVDIGDQSIKSRRSTIRVPCGPQGRIGDYVPFYFAPRSPMLFSIKCGNVAGVSPDQRRLAYLVSDTDDAYAAGLSCVFTDGNAATAFTEFEDDPTRLGDLVDWPLMQEIYWNNTADDQDRRRRRMAEFLVHERMPLEIIRGIGVYDHGMRVEVASIVGSGMPVAVRHGWYF